MKCPNCKIDLEMKEINGQIFEKCPKCVFSHVKNHLRIEKMFAYVSVDPEDDNEGVIAMKTPNGITPMVGADMARVNFFAPYAEQAAKNAGIKVRLYEFSKKTLLQEIEP